jgi:dihydroorotate dehydrogenase (fumarate)
MNESQPSINLQTSVGGIHMDTCIYNAAGARCTIDNELFNLNTSNTGAILTKSTTIYSRMGNAKPKYYDNINGSINANGLENLGMSFYREFSKNPLNKPYIISVAGLGKDDIPIILEYLDEVKNLKKSWSPIKNISITSPQKQKQHQNQNQNPYNISGVEVNLSCPNVSGMPQLGYSYDDIEETIMRIVKTYNGVIGLKLPPYFDDMQFFRIASIISRFEQIKYITCCNSLGNGLIIDTNSESVVIHPRKGFGGVGGLYIKPTALANVVKFRELLPENIDIVGCGGVSTGLDVFEHILCGASAVQIGTQLMKEGVDCFERITKELIDIMRNKSYTKIDDFKGKLKTI